MIQAKRSGKLVRKRARGVQTLKTQWYPSRNY